MATTINLNREKIEGNWNFCKKNTKCSTCGKEILDEISNYIGANVTFTILIGKKNGLEDDEIQIIFPFTDLTGEQITDITDIFEDFKTCCE